MEADALDMEVPFSDLLKALNPLDSSSFSFPFKVRFFEQSDTSDTTLLQTSSVFNDLTLVVCTSPASTRQLLPQISLELTYNQILFSHSRAEIILSQLQKVIEAGADAEISHIKLVDSDYGMEDLHWDEWPGAIHDIFAKNARNHPERVCIVEDSETGSNLYTYEHIRSACCKLARYIVMNGVEREDVVVIYAHRSATLAVAIMAVLMAGATFSVIDPKYPPARQQIYLSVAQPRALIMISQAGKLDSRVDTYIKDDLALKCSVPALCLTESGVAGGVVGDTDILLSIDDSELGIPIGIDSIGTLSFTSGSTGIPKGVQGRHFSLTHFYPWMAKEFNLSSNSKFTMLSGIAHDPIQRDIFTPFFLGAQLCIPTEASIGTPGQLAVWMAKHEITVTHLTPAMGQLLAANADTLIPKLEHSFFVGDILTKRDVQRLQHLAPNCNIVNMYGTTETQRAVSHFVIPAASQDSTFLMMCKEIMPAGKGMVDVQLLVINRHSKKLCAAGEIGEIYVRSSGLAEGYLRLADVTKEKFLVNWMRDAPAPSNEGEFFKGPRDRLYRTGDLGRYMPNGNVECVGRADDQVKIRGFRIELGEIDTHLSQHPKVRENVTLVRRDKNEEQTLISYFVPLLVDGDPVSSSVDESESPKEPRFTRLIKDIRGYLKGKLPSYSIPTVFVPLKRMPLTPNGKVDKNALPFPDTVKVKPEAKGDKLAMTATEKRIHEIWSKLLDCEVGLEDNFFDLGGHSILATRMIFEIRQQLWSEAPLSLVFREPTIKGMSSEIDTTRQQVFNDENDRNNDKVMFEYSTELNRHLELLQDKYQLDSFPEAKKATFFLTGATGFLGVFILASLLERNPECKVICLIRAKDTESGLKRLQENAEAHLVWKDSWNQSIQVVCGNLESENFGIAEWNDLCQKVDVVIHNGALVHWVYPYSKLQAANVQGTLEAFKLCTTTKIKPLCFISSTSVLDTEKYVIRSELNIEQGLAGVEESDDLEASRHGLQTGYGNCVFF